ncbi:GrpB family protein [Agromyces archimandritae]|uniref:GrpB family protein n=1 Tax=Agromyces archimandritae TaxID=2781962 RepID=A0A975FNK5_9MICO|nr:GrpB family protein [Agromyces archimandritae]QTX04783.1 GrpB family protein [Agromyces archimandritae]
MPTAHDIMSFSDAPPAGASPWVVRPRVQAIEVVPADERWPTTAAAITGMVQDVLGTRALQLEHVGSTSVPGLPAKPVIDLDLIVADPADEAGWLPPLEQAGFVLTVRESWWHEHRCLQLASPRANLHVFGPDRPEPWRHRIFRDRLRADRADRERYAELKREAAAAATERGETVMQYNARKEALIREIYGRAFRAAGLVGGAE